MDLPTVAVAECATCGTVAAEFGAVWGAAQYFKGGLVVYTPEAKIKFLGLKESVATNFISDPEAVVKDMAMAVSKEFNSRIGISTSGFATPYKPDGIMMPYIWYAIYDRETGFVKVDKILNTEYLSRAKFQRKVGMSLHVQYMIYVNSTKSV